VPRHARVVFAKVPHHVTQRGNHRQRVFFTAGDRMAYLRLLKEHAERHEVEIIAYCLMTNHVHLVATPAGSDGLHRVFKPVNGHYAQRINRVKKLKGHLWQGRFYSSPLDFDYLLNAVRYVELNPVEAGIVARAEDYAWSSAATHCCARRDPVVAFRPRSVQMKGIDDWSQWLAAGITDEVAQVLRLNGGQNLPCGSNKFIEDLENLTGRSLRHRPRGAPRRTSAEEQKGGSPPQMGRSP
jgi:putative transposase